MAVKKPTRRKKGNVVSVDFTGVEAGGATVPDGRYKAKVTEVSQEVGQTSGEPYLQLTWEITSDKCNGRELKFDNYSLQPQALWRLKSMLEAMEVEVPDGEQDIDFDEIISDGTECIVEVTGEKSPEGKTYARVTGHAPLSDGNTVDDEEEDEKPARKPKKPVKDEDEEEEEEPPKRRGKQPADDEDEDEEPPQRRGKPSKDEEEEEEDDEEKPVNKKLKKGAKVKFKNEKNKLTKGTIETIDGDQAVVVTADDESYEIDLEDLTVIG